ncbi:MAG: hypothetical protein DRP72_00305 [Candidatus Omnitrophota bacterium]|nr:MAG: hypothetical protein DRP72_00305 [Candidatus Omnitrophota bacterium]
MKLMSYNKLYPSAITIFERWEKVSHLNSQNKAIYFKEAQNYRFLTYEELFIRSVQLGEFLIQKGIKKGDKVAIIMENNFLWPQAFFGIIYSGATAVLINPQSEATELNYLITHSHSKYIIASSTLQNKFRKVSQTIPILYIDKQAYRELSYHNSKPQQLSTNDIASIIYTSGTTQKPKGVILTHENLLSNIDSLQQLNILTSQDCFVSILPLYHAYPFMVNLLLPLFSGAKISYPPSRDIADIIDCLKQTHGTILVCVPQLLFLLHQKIKKNIFTSPLKNIFINCLLRLSYSLRKTLRVNPAKIILKELHHRFGKSFRFFISGGAKLDPQIAKDFFLWGFTVLEGYGLTETSPVVTLNLPHQFKFNSVGKPIPGVVIKINHPDSSGIGEILIRGKNVFVGYYQADDISRQVLKEGWFFSGDLGYIDKDGFLYLKGGKKEIIVLSSGKKIVPEEVESQYLKSPFIEELCVFLSKSKEKEILTAVVVPNYKQFYEKEISQIKDRLRWEIENISKTLPSYQRIKKYIIATEKLPKTLLGKIKRYEVEKRYSHLKGETEKTEKILPQDKALLSSPLCKKALEYLARELKRPVHLDDNLELDLGLDSLEQIGLFLGFQKAIGIRIKEEEFIDVFTVRDVLERLKDIEGEGIDIQREEKISWQQLLKEPISEDAKKTIVLSHSLLEIIINFLLTSILKVIARTVFSLKVIGKNNLPKNGPFILSPNHSSYLDGPILAASLPFTLLINTYFLGYAVYFKHPLIRWANRLLRLIPIDVRLNLVESLKVCSYILNNSKILCMFPEGVRSVNGNIGEFKQGIGILIKELDIKVVPVYIKGTYQAWPCYRKFPKLFPVTVIFGKSQNLEDLITKECIVDIYRNIVDNLRKKVTELQKLS